MIYELHNWSTGAWGSSDTVLKDVVTCFPMYVEKRSVTLRG